ncbi:transforming growth factor beta activator LRRC32-like isoform X1 [Hypomesus transpacificus]|uniref:transforming growth factor beta activator LRRC32-like isoform X1 n=1 Tax=Hypomesus transpacificus TaxID=137520 RepID=UPI001F07A72B|nr:transforming growth factor beta activator LRRC32-like isoform X1 [Hypomesus transpacificus]
MLSPLRGCCDKRVYWVNKSQQAAYLVSTSLLSSYFFFFHDEQLYMAVESCSAAQTSKISRMMMGHTLNLFYLFWSHSLLYPVFGRQDLHYQELSQQHQNLTSIPDGLDPSLRGLDLSHNMIRQLGLLALPDLKRLDLSYNHVELMDDLVFQHVPELIELNLACNELNNNVEINSKTLQRLQTLRRLDMSLNSLDGDAVGLYISNMSSLEHLDLTGNTLMKLMSKSFTGAKSLRTISLENNVISDIEPGTFKTLRELESLNLARNNLAHICDFKLHQVKFLNLSRNSIAFFVTHEDEELYKLEILDLSHNNLLYFPIVPKTSRLRHLHLQHNMLGAMSTEVQVPESNTLYKEITCAKNSTLENDNIYSNWRHMPLVYVDLSNNHFRYFPLQTLRYLTALETLNLSTNCLSDVSYDSAQDGTVGNLAQPLFPSLRYFDLQNNDITHFSPLSLQSLPRIETLNLQQNTVKPCDPRPKPDNMTKPSPQPDLSCVNFSQIRTLRHLNLQDNGIEVLHPKTFDQTPLVSLKLARNEDLMIHLGALEGVQRSLQSLSISEINMTNTDWSLPCLTALTQLNISYNNLVAIPDSIVCSPIRELDVRNNAFVSLDDSLVANLSVRLRVLYISGNALNCCDTNWLIILRKAKVNIPDLYKSECITAYNGSLILLTEFLHNPSLFCLYESGTPELSLVLVIIFILFVSTAFTTLVVCIQKVCCQRGSFIV